MKMYIVMFMPAFIVALYIVFRIKTTLIGLPETNRIRQEEENLLVNYKVMEFWYWFLTPIKKLFLFLRITPNMITLFSLIVNVVGAFFIIKGRFYIAGWLLILGGSLDCLDGILARALNAETLSGKYLDSIIDRVSDSVVFLGFLLFYSDHWVFFLVALAFTGTVMVSYSQSKAESMQLPYWKGLMKRHERILYLGAPMILTPLFNLISLPENVLSLFPLTLLGILFIGVFSSITVIKRIFDTMSYLRSSSSN